MNFLSGIAGKILVFLGMIGVILITALRLISIGGKKAKAEIKEANAKRKLKIMEAIKDQEKIDEVITRDNIEKAENGNFSGFNRKPNGMRNSKQSD